MDYRCNRSFTSTKGTHYYSGKEIYSGEYYSLQPSERNNFTALTYETSISSQSNSSNDDWSPPVAAPSYDTDISIGDSGGGDNDFSGFDGGDSGGGGASGDW